MVKDVSSGVAACLVLKNEEDIEADVLPLAGAFHDQGDRLLFADGNIHVILDADDCNLAAHEPLEVNEEDIAAKKEDDGGIRSLRGLSPRSAASDASHLYRKNNMRIKRSDILFRNRAEYTASLAAIKEGRRLYHAYGYAVLCIDAGFNCGEPDVS